jgi:hypothetical protein
LRCLWMWRPSVEHVGDGLALVRRQGRDKDQRLDSLVGHGGDHRAGISVRYQDYGVIGALQRAVKRGDVIR